MSSNPRGGNGGNSPGSLAAQVSTMTIGRQVQRESEQALTRAGVPIPQEVFLPEKKPPCPHGPQVQPVNLTTNMWFLSQKVMPIYKYDVEFRGIMLLGGGQTRVVRFTKRSPDNMVMLDLRDKVLAVFQGLVNKHRDFFNGPVFCDLQSALYTTTELPLDELKPDQTPGQRAATQAYKFDDITYHDINPAGLFQENFARFEVAFKPVRDRFDLELGNIERLVTNSATNVDRSLLQFLELATSNHILMHPHEHVVFPAGKSYLMSPPAHGFTPDDMLLSNGANQLDPTNLVYLAIGVHKSVRLVSGPKNTGGCVLVVETKKSPFHMPGPLIEKVRTLAAPNSVDNISNNPGLLNTLTTKYRGKYVVTASNAQYNPQGGQRLLRLKQFVPATSRSHKFNFQGRDTSIEDYFRLKYGYNINHPTAPLVQVSERGRTVHYPIELLDLADNQRIGMAEADPMMIRNMIRACAIEPQKLLAQNQKNLEALNLESPDLQALGIGTRGPLQVTGSIHSAPKLSYANMEVQVQQGKWRTANARYLSTPGTQRWAAVYISGGNSDRFNMDDLTRYVTEFMKMAAQKGLPLGKPKLDQVPANEPAFKAKMSELAQQGVEYILFAHTETDRTIHGKYLMKWAETHHGFVTQDTKLKTCRDVAQGKPQTLENLVNKANVKLGGLNYTFSRNDPNARRILDDVLYIGFGANHPGGGLGMDSENASGGSGNGNGNGNGNGHGSGDKAKARQSGPPTVVGFSANCSKDAFEFVGDFMFQEARRDEKVSVIATIVDRCLEQYNHNRKSLPKRIVLFRNGCAEGQFANILKYEVPLVVHAIESIANKYGGEPAKLTVIVPNKMHNVRFFPNPIPSGRAPEQNVKPGTTIDQTVTSMNHWEFYLSAHTALQGTAKVPRYTVLYDQNNISSENLQRLVYWLCHGHQIVALTTSLPAPVHIANEYAKRGRNIYRSVTTVGDNNTHDGDRYKRMTNEQLNDSLTYWTGAGGLMMSYRVNA